MIVENIISFLNNRDWYVSGENQNFIEMSAPDVFNLPQNFRIHIPKIINKSDSEKIS